MRPGRHHASFAGDTKLFPAAGGMENRGSAAPAARRAARRTSGGPVKREHFVIVIPIACVALAVLPFTCATVAVGELPPHDQAETPEMAWARTSLDTLIMTERAFSQLSVERGMKTAFLTYLAADGLIYRPGPVNGRKVWNARANPPGTLIWAPAYAEVAGNADLGWTTGPYEYRSPGPSHGDSRSEEIEFGHYVTVWTRPIEWVPDSEMVWRVALDIGVSNDAYATSPEDTPLERGPAHEWLTLDRAPGVGYGIGVGMGPHGATGIGMGTGVGISARDQRWQEMKHAVNDLLKIERDYGFDWRLKGASTAIGKYASEDVRVYREGSQPTLGKLKAIPLLEKQNRDREWISLGSRVSTSYDLGGSWGLARTRRSPADTSAFLHLWRRDPHGRWVLVLDVENEYPKHK